MVPNRDRYQSTFFEKGESLSLGKSKFAGLYEVKMNEAQKVLGGLIRWWKNLKDNSLKSTACFCFFERSGWEIKSVFMSLPR